MSNKEKIMWAAGAICLVFLFLLSSTDWIIAEKEREVYQLSVIVEDSSDEYYVNFKKGMDKAAESLHADVDFITLYAPNDLAQQIELIQREIKEGADALIVAPVDESEFVMRLDEISPSCPIILLGTSNVSASVAASIGINGFEAGEQLAGRIEAKESRRFPVCLLTEGLNYTGNKERYDGIHSALSEAGFTCRLIEKQSEDTYRQAIEETVYPGKGRMTVVALDAAALSEAAAIIGGSSVYKGYITGLYGFGSTVSILNELDRGVVDGLMTHSQFDEGYLSVKMAVEAVRGMRLGEQAVMDSIYVEAKDLRDSRYEKLLYPME